MNFEETIKMAYAGSESALERLRAFADEIAATKGIGKVDKVATRRLLVWLKNLSASDKKLFEMEQV
jgi:hypothetical protein